VPWRQRPDHPNADLRRAKWAASPQSLALLRCVRFRFGLGARRRSRPFQMYRLTIGGLSVGQAQLGNEVGGTDKIFRGSNPSVLEIAGGQPFIAPGVQKKRFDPGRPAVAIVWPDLTFAREAIRTTLYNSDH
jgi:hypothetical protein